MDTSLIQSQLRQHEIFSLLPDDLCATLAHKASIEKCSGKTPLFSQGDEQPYCLLILEGEVHILLAEANGKELLMTTLGKGDLLGEMTLLDGLPRSASAVTKTACTFLKIMAADFDRMVTSHPEIQKPIISYLCARLRRTDEQLMMIALADLPTRLATFLLGKMDKSHTVSMGLKQGELASHLATTRESLNKLLQLWQGQDILRLLPDQRIEIINPDRLQKLAGE